MARTLNPRRQALRMIRDAKRILSILTARWDERQTIYERTTDQGHGNWRIRRPEERIENKGYEWHALVQYATMLERNARELKEFAAAQRDRLARESEDQ